MTPGRELFLGLDVGTQSTKAVLVDVDGGAVVARASAPHRMVEGLPTGHMEQDPCVWLDAVRAAVRSAIASIETDGRIAGIGVSGQQHGAVLVDADLAPVRAAKLWCDTSTAAEARALSAALGRPIPTGFTAPKLRFTADREPEVWARTRHVLLPHDFVNAWLTGEVFTERGDASGTGYLNVLGGEYDDAALAAVAPDLENRVPPLMATDAVAGGVTGTSSAKLGVPQDTPVSAGGGDNMMSAIGAGATRPGPVICSLGTSATLFTCTETNDPDPSGAVAAFRASSTREAGGSPGHLPLVCLMNCTAPLEELRVLTGASHRELTERASAVAPGSRGVRFLPFLAGERVPDLPDASASFTGLRTGTLEPGVLYRAALEGIATHLAYGLGRLEARGIGAAELRVVGGAAANPLLLDLIAAQTGRPVVPLEEHETAAVGAALQVCAATRGVSVDGVGQAFPLAMGARREPDPALRRDELIEAFAADIDALLGPARS